MKYTNLINIVATGALCLVIASCDNIDSDNRYLPVEKPEEEGIPKMLLIQEFTGHMCTNCPEGAAAIHSIDEAFPGRMITVGMHPAGGGPNTQPLPGQNFRCDEAQVMYEYFLPSGFPCAVFNGIEQTTAIQSWFTIASGMFNQTAKMSIEAISDYNSSTREVTIDYSIHLVDDFDDSLNVMVWIMENGIIGAQLNAGVMEYDYVHNHVLRASLNGDWGQNLPTPLEKGQTVTGSASMTVDPKWVAENCQVVVYVFHNSNKYVEQAALVDVVAQ